MFTGVWVDHVHEAHKTCITSGTHSNRSCLRVDGEQPDVVDLYSLLRTLLAILPVFLSFLLARPFAVHFRGARRFRVLAFRLAMIPIPVPCS
jgi:hypothetical protein